MSKVMLVAVLLPLAVVVASAQFTEWSPPVNLGPVVNSQYHEIAVEVSKNGLSMYYTTYRPNGAGGWDLWVSQRASIAAAWGPPRLVPNVNSTAEEFSPALSPDEHRLYFVSTRSGGCGGYDLFVSRRHDRNDDFGWQKPVNLGCLVNSAGNEGQPSLFEDDDGNEVMYFSSNRGGNSDIYATCLRDDGEFDPPLPVAELNSPFEEGTGAVRRDGLEIILGSTRPGGLGNLDLWTSTRESTSEPWSPPVNLTVLNSSAYDGARMRISFDGRTLYYGSTRPGGYGYGDLYTSTRERRRGP
jgi:hypothetical protein